MASFAGTSVFSSRCPAGGVDFSGKRVALIGTGSTGVQAAPVVARQAQHFFLFQRSAAYTFPTTSRPFESGELDVLKAGYESMANAASRPALESSAREEQLAALEEFGMPGALFWSDVTSDMDANEMARALYGEAIAGIVEDPATAASLVPRYPFGCKRPIIDDGYFDMFNRDNVTLVDLHLDPVIEITPTGIRTESDSYPVDVIFYATGFDGLTGALTGMDIHGVGGVSLRDRWTEDGPATFLGLGVSGFPNMFLMSGPGGPGAFSNVLTALELQVDWMGDCVAYLQTHGYRAIEARADAQQAWTDQLVSLVEGGVTVHPSCNSWWIGANVPGKKRVFMSYAGGIPEYRRQCQEVASSGYQGFALT